MLSNRGIASTKLVCVLVGPGSGLDPGGHLIALSSAATPSKATMTNCLEVAAAVELTSPIRES